MRWRVFLTAATAAMVVAAGTVTMATAADGSAAAPPTSARSTGADRASGQAAVDRLGDRLPVVAAAHGMTAAELRDRLLADVTMFVDRDDRIGFIEPVVDTAQVGSGDGGVDATAAGDVFALRSKPGAAKVLYLDFDGHMLSGTVWNGALGGDCAAEAFDTDGNPATFSDAERNVVAAVWSRVAEDYAPFDIDVTTADPGYAAVNRAAKSDVTFGTRVVVTRSTSPCPNGATLYAAQCATGCGGLAYVGVFDNIGADHDRYQPALVFQNGVGDNAKTIAEAASHEAGHTLGLSHDSTTTSSYYLGHGNWAPIMGVGYYRPVTQWSNGDYADAGNREDDFAVMAGSGLAVRADDHGNTAATATLLLGRTPVTDGFIAGRTDLDAFTLPVGSGKVTITAAPSPVSPNLDLRMQLLDATGAVVAVADPPSGATGADTATGLGAVLALDLPEGLYTVVLDGTGAGDATTGYSDYGSLGSYRLSADVPAPVALTRSDVSAVNTTGSLVRNGAAAVANVAVQDQDARPVAGAAVSVAFSIGTSTKVVAVRTGTTDASGWVALSSGSLKVSAGSTIRACVTTLSSSTAYWDRNLFAPVTDCGVWTVG